MTKKQLAKLGQEIAQARAHIAMLGIGILVLTHDGLIVAVPPDAVTFGPTAWKAIDNARNGVETGRK